MENHCVIEIHHETTWNTQYGASFIMMHTIKLCKFNYLNAQIVSFVECYLMQLVQMIVEKAYSKLN